MNQDSRDATEPTPSDGAESAEQTERMLPCPSCGEKDVDATFSFGEAQAAVGYVNAGCMVCGMMGPDSHTARDAVDRWNALPRASQSAVAASEPICLECEEPRECHNNDYCYRETKPLSPRSASDDSRRLDYIENWIAAGRRKGFAWDSLSFDTNKTVRKQLDDKMQATDRREA